MKRLALLALLLCLGATAPAPARFKVDWSNVHSTSGCFFFSGPLGLGRDTQLGDRASVDLRGRAFKLSFEGATFEGLIDGGRVKLTRKSQYEFGSAWHTTETIEGIWSEGTLVGHYRYEECDTSGAQGCPGRCTIDADLRAYRPLPKKAR